MAIIVLAFGCAIGFVVALVHVFAFGASIPQGILTYFGLSLTTAGTFAAVSWIRSSKGPEQRTRPKTFEDQLEDWMDWQMQEAMDSPLQTDVSEEEDSRKSA